MSDPTLEGIPWRVRRLEEWRSEIERLKPEVQAEVLRRVEKKVDTLTRVIVSIGIALIGSMGALIVTLFLGMPK